MRSVWRLIFGIGGLYGLLFAFFFVVALVLVLFGVNLDRVDNWLDARGDWFDWAGTILFKTLLAIILVCCVFVVGKGIFDRVPLPGRPPRHKKRRAARAGGTPRLSESGEVPPAAAGGGEYMAGYRVENEAGAKPMGCGAVIAAIIIGYFAYVGLVM